MLGDANVLEELPGGVGESSGAFAAQLGGEAAQRMLQRSMGLFPIERRRDDLSPFLVLTHGRLRWKVGSE